MPDNKIIIWMKRVKAREANNEIIQNTDRDNENQRTGDIMNVLFVFSVCLTMWDSISIR